MSARRGSPGPRASARRRTPVAAAPPTVTAALADLERARLPRSFYDRDVAEVARALIGCAIVHGDRAVLIVETEAYRGPEDGASHARFGATARTAPMFGPPGHAYVYLCYGAHQMFNVVADAEGRASAVLIRGAAPLCGLPADASVARGPGKLAAALRVDRRHSGHDLTLPGSELYLSTVPGAPAAELVIGPRVGVDYAGEWARAPLRFAWRAHPAISKPTPETPWR